MKKLATRTEAIDFSLIREVFAAAAKIKNSLDLSIGQPDFVVPTVVKEAAAAAIKADRNGYTPTAGIPELRQALVKKLTTKNQIKCSVDQVMVTAGTSGGIFLALSALLNPLDEVIIFDPYFVIYKQLVEFLGAIPVLINTAPDWQPKIEDVKQVITARTKLIIVNSPIDIKHWVWHLNKVSQVDSSGYNQGSKPWKSARKEFRRPMAQTLSSTMPLSCWKGGKKSV
ncbi:MAG: aminotransferase class I/II-fold pyridoxal phosphate-dependent enzyme [bacterium]|nr:aminotransferase class I/II-fold pyridoxal phosphate-dependent enzyme [bacterium]